MQRIDHLLPWSHLGTERTLSVFRYGAGTRKVYIQASLHADELPGMRVAVELKRRLHELEEQGHLTGVIELVPMANPIGIAQTSAMLRSFTVTASDSGFRRAPSQTRHGTSRM